VGFVSFLLEIIIDLPIGFPINNIISLGVFPACSWLALVAGVEGYVLAGIEIGVFSYIFLYFCGY